MFASPLSYTAMLSSMQMSSGGKIGTAAPVTFLAISNAFIPFCSSISGMFLLSGSGGAGIATSLPVVIQVQALSSLIMANMVSKGMSGPSMKGMADAVASGFSAGFSTVLFSAISPVAVGAGTGRVLVSNPVLLTSAITAALPGPDGFKIASSIASAISTYLVSILILQAVAVGTPVVPPVPLAMTPTSNFFAL